MLTLERQLSYRNTRTKIAFAEDSRNDAVLISRLLQKSEHDQFDIENTRSLEATVMRLGAARFDLVLLDLNLPDSQGLKNVTACIQAAPEVPVVVLTGQYDENTARRAISLGAQDFLCKDELNTRILCRILHHSIERKRNETELLSRALYDAQTGLPNRQHLSNYWHERRGTFKVNRANLFLFYIDVDGLKHVNDTFGHKFGDDLIATIAARLRAALGPGAFIARLGGDEFCAIISNPGNGGDTDQLQENLRSAISAPLEAIVGGYRPSASIGMVKYQISNLPDLDEALAEADRRMYVQKEKLRAASAI